MQGVVDTLARDTLAGAAGAVHDTLTAPPLPGGVATVFRFFFQVPQWIQIGGALVGAAVALFLLRWIWVHRQQILTWLRTRSREVQLGLAGAVLVGVIVASFIGMQSWNYMMHDNDFCTGCHVMEAPFQRFATGAGKHQRLNCHDCHQQGMYANVRQLVLWVAERPEKIGSHAPVPNARCAKCHMVAPETPGVAATAGRERWEHVQRLAGHRVHFESDSTRLDSLQCVTCHGAEVHRFIPSTRTCGQNGCHEKQPVKLAGMAKLGEIQCVTCHAFRTDLPGLATRDSARRAMVPARDQCQSCHQMKDRPGSYDYAKDPHKGSCGSCHDVHKDLAPADARKACKTCHADLSKSPFHQGVNHKRVESQCVTCHTPHAASVDASDCVSCHNAVRKRGLFKAPLPFDTNAVLKGRLSTEPRRLPE
jgi:nitrate/TMAO reductase-like tetraheme cytochrome c subunit